MTSFERIVNFLTHISDRIAQLAVMAMLFLIVGNILSRVVWKPILGTYDIAGFIGAILVSFALGHCAIKKGHIQVELLVQRFPERIQVILGTLTGILSLFIFSLVTWQCIVLGNDMRRVGELSMSAHISFYPYIYGIAYGCGLLSLVILIETIKSLIKAIKE